MGAVELRAAWRGAAEAAGMSKDDQGIRETPEMQLVAQARRAAQAKAWEPADVAQERQETELARGDMAAESMMADAAARNAEGPDAPEAQELAGGFRQLTEELSERAAWLAERDEHRREWHAANAARIARGVQARAELERRREAGEVVSDWDIVMAYLPPEPEPGGPETPSADETANDAPVTADEAETEAESRAERFQEIADHRERAVEHSGRAERGDVRAAIEAARASQARINEERAEAEAGEHPAGGPAAAPSAEAELSAEAGDDR
jgi:hypothetical protein